MQTCYRHSSRETGVSCSNCGRPICPDCMTPTTVGMRCPECSKQRTPVQTLRTMVVQPRVTYALIAINVVAFLAEGSFSLTGGGGVSSVVTHGWLDRGDIAVNHEYWRLITSGFLHASLIHIGFNMYLLYVLGQLLEPALGPVKFVTIYFTALLAGSFGALVATSNPSLGASGAVFGLMGAAALEFRARGISVMQSGIGTLIIINLVLSFTIANISVGAHIGGLIGGGLAALALQTGDRHRSRILGLAACVALAVVAVAGAVAVAGSTGVNG